MSPIDATSWTLIRKAAAGNPQSREHFAERYGPVLKAYLAARWHLPFDHDQVEDCSQEIFVQCFKSDGALQRVEPEREGGFRAFLYGVARNVAAMHERSRRRHDREVREHTGFELDDLRADEPSLSQVFDRAWAVMITKEARELMASRVADGDAARGRVLELRYQGRQAPREIAARLGLDVQQVYEMLRRAKHEYRIALLEIMGSYHPDAGEQELEHRCIELLRLL